MDGGVDGQVVANNDQLACLTRLRLFHKAGQTGRARRKEKARAGVQCLSCDWMNRWAMQ